MEECCTLQKLRAQTKSLLMIEYSSDLKGKSSSGVRRLGCLRGATVWSKLDYNMAVELLSTEVS